MVPMSASSAVQVPPPTGFEVLEGGLRDFSLGEDEEVSRSPWCWPKGVDFQPANFGLTFLIRSAIGMANQEKITP